jgi:hypothetical protein
MKRYLMAVRASLKSIRADFGYMLQNLKWVWTGGPE